MRKILVLGLGLMFLAGACNKSEPVTTNNSTQQNSNQTSQNQQVQSGPVEIVMSPSGYSPANVTVKKGTEVVFKNTDSVGHWPASAPHPAHTDYPGFDPKKAVAAGETWSFTFDKVGNWKFHDHLNATGYGFGAVTVVE